MRWLSLSTLMIFLAGLLAPAIIALDFMVERDRIMQELCVQRLVPEDVRTCHGQCYLMRALSSVEQKQKDLPVELRSFRLDDVTLSEVRLTFLPPLLVVLLGPERGSLILTGPARTTDHVPWA